MKRIKLISIASILILVGIVLSSSHQFSSQAENDKVLDEISKYKNWAQIHRPDEKNSNGAFLVTDSSVAGWSFIVSSPSLALPEPVTEETTDTIDVNIKDVLTKPGTRLIMPAEEGAIERGEIQTPRIFDTYRPSSGSSRKTNPHEVGMTSYGRVYANDIAKSHLSSKYLPFPVGSIIIREKYSRQMEKIPQVVTAMVKREKGFSKKTGDWEFFTFNGSDLELQKRQTKSDCSKCHSQAKNTDYVFREYLK